jgi:riboflavin kinase/FMN adenylyltransferase
LEERTKLIRSLGIELVVALPFTPELGQLSAREFVLLLKDDLKMRGLVIGQDFALGRGREGDVAYLNALGQELDFSVDVVQPFKRNGETVSSTAIRDALARGDVAKVTRFLGRNFSLSGPVVRGVERGRTLGFPTANLAVNSNQALPADGVYATRVRTSSSIYSAVVNIGQRPTFGEKDRTVEVYLLDFEGDLYGEEIKVELVERLRAEKKFDSADELKAQISRDVERARVILDGTANGGE